MARFSRAGLLLCGVWLLVGACYAPTYQPQAVAGMPLLSFVACSTAVQRAHVMAWGCVSPAARQGSVWVQAECCAP
jgi:hypothetical protein